LAGAPWQSSRAGDGAIGRDLAAWNLAHYIPNDFDGGIVRTRGLLPRPRAFRG